LALDGATIIDPEGYGHIQVHVDSMGHSAVSK
jgi:hypothetical protein